MSISVSTERRAQTYIEQGGQLLPSMGREKREWVVDPIGPCGPGSDFVSLNTVLEWD